MKRASLTELRKCPKCKGVVTLAPYLRAVWAYHWPPGNMNGGVCPQSGKPLRPGAPK